MEQSNTKIILDYLSNSLSNNFIDKRIFEKTEAEKLSQMICKTLELTNFIEDNSHYKLVVEKESDTVLNFRVIKDV